MHRVSELREMVDEFLCHRVAPVQKIALEILVAFKLKFLLPYKVNMNMKSYTYTSVLILFSVISRTKKE